MSTRKIGRGKGREREQKGKEGGRQEAPPQKNESKRKEGLDGNETLWVAGGAVLVMLDERETERERGEKEEEELYSMHRRTRLV